MKFASGWFNRFMQLFAYLMVSVILVGVLVGLGYLYKIEKITGQDIALGMILSSVLSVWTAANSKIFRTKIEFVRKEPTE